ncbi:hypothetical protein ABW19_dt0206005 [Dactylella cylindrospora]|nr:hypothetical protein ABW19_dt0206005 [Dactylella cylindrospora]
MPEEFENMVDAGLYAYQARRRRGVPIPWGYILWSLFAVFVSFMFMLTIVFAWNLSFFALPWLFLSICFFFREKPMVRTYHYNPTFTYFDKETGRQYDWDDLPAIVPAPPGGDEDENSHFENELEDRESEAGEEARSSPEVIVLQSHQRKARKKRSKKKEGRKPTLGEKRRKPQ